MAYQKPYQGYFNPRNPEKWVISEKGLAKGEGIIYRSGLEYRFMVYADTNPNIIKVASEPFPIPYISPIDQREHRYYVDFLIEDSNHNRTLIEIKPHSQCSPPKKNKKKKESVFIKESKTYAVNEAKWISAKRWCEFNNATFTILTEKHLKN